MRSLKLQFWISSWPIVVFQLLVVVLAYALVENRLEFLAIGRLDFNWFFEKGPKDIAEFYPNWYWFIYAVTRLVKYGVPALALLLVFHYPNDSQSNGMPAIDKKDFVARLVIPFCLTICIALAAYWLVGLETSNPYLFQLKVSRGFLIANAANLIVLAIRFRQTVKNILWEFFNEENGPLALGITRVIFFFHMMTYYEGHAVKPDLGALERVELPLIGWLIDIMPISPDLYFYVSVCGIVAAFFVMIGYRTRLFLILHAVIVFYIIAVPNFYGKLAHDHMTIWMSWIMVFSPCADVLSIDAWRKGNGLFAPKSDVNYGFHLKVVWLHFGLIYFFAGYFKFWYSGFDWALSDSMVNQIRLEWFEHFNKVPDFRPDLFPNTMKLAGFLVVIFELIYPFLLFGKTTRWFAIFGGLAMHRSIKLIMYIGFKYLQVVYMVFVPWDTMIKKLKVLTVQNKVVGSARIKWRSVSIVAPLAILVINLFFGLGDVNSYPFSIYPTYSSLVPRHVKHLEYRILDPDKEHVVVWEEGKKHGFIWEHYSRTEYHIIRTNKNGKLDTNGVETLWKRWQLAIPTLQRVDSVDVFVVERSLDPDSIDMKLGEEFLMTVRSK